MGKLQPLGMEMEPLVGVRARAVEAIAPNWRIQPLGMGRMDAQLVGAPGEGVKRHPRPTVGLGQHLKPGLAGLTVLPMDALVGPLGRVTPERQVDQA
jgi:hypothetical protein